MIVEKKIFQIPSFTFQNGRTLPVNIGYETDENLSHEKDKVILVVH